MVQNGLKLHKTKWSFLTVKNGGYPSKWWVQAKALLMFYLGEQHSGMTKKFVDRTCFIGSYIPTLAFCILSTLFLQCQICKFYNKRLWLLLKFLKCPNNYFKDIFILCNLLTFQGAVRETERGCLPRSRPTTLWSFCSSWRRGFCQSSRPFIPC